MKAKSTPMPPEENERIVDKLTMKLNLPEDLISREPIITLYGKHRLLVENYHNIISVEKNEILIQAKTTRILVKGTNLTIAYYNSDEMMVVGHINSLEYR